MKQTEKIIEHLSRVQSRRAQFDELFSDFRETVARAVTEKTFPVKGIYIGHVSPQATFHVGFNHRRFRVVLNDNIEKGCGEVSAYKLDEENKNIHPAILQFTFNGQGVTDIKVTQRKAPYVFTNYVDSVAIILNMIDQAL